METPPQSSPVKTERLTSLDAFRGTIMILMASAGLGASRIAEHFPNSPAWQFFGRQCEHAAWAGCTFWDLIQPAFMFMVGVALPWSIANRQARGQSFSSLLGHGIWRGLVLVLLAVFLSSAWSSQTNWVFVNVLAQIGLGYPFLFLIAFAQPRTQWGLAIGLLLVYWFAFALHPLPATDFDWEAVGVPANWPFLEGFAAHWEKNANFAARFDLWFLNLFPRTEAFVFNRGGYQTLNFVPSLVTMIFGLFAGRLLKSELKLGIKVRNLIIAGLAAITIGQLIAWAGICPLVKRIWTPSWAIYSTGWVLLMLAGCVAVVDGLKLRRLVLPLVVVGLNPITMYCLWQLSGGFIRGQMQTHLGEDIFQSLGVVYTPMLERGSVLLILWLITYWMYRKKLFIRI